MGLLHIYIYIIYTHYTKFSQGHNLRLISKGGVAHNHDHAKCWISGLYHSYTTCCSSNDLRTTHRSYSYVNYISPLQSTALLICTYTLLLYHEPWKQGKLQCCKYMLMWNETLAMQKYMGCR